MAAQVIDGKAAAARLTAEVARLIAAGAAGAGVKPGLHVVLVGEDAASTVYVGAKERQARKLGLASHVHRLPAETSQTRLLDLIAALNADDAVDGILVQLPLPSQIDADAVIEAIDPAKDVDGFHPVNVGRLAVGRAALVPCTPQGAMILLRQESAALAGLRALVIGRSAIVGKPMAQLLLQADCTVTIAHSRSRGLADLCREADVLVAAIGRPAYVQGDWVKRGALVIDVGINRLADGTLAGDVDFEAARRQAGAITPVPGGVGPMTIACLMRNTLVAAATRRGLPAPEVPGLLP